MQPKKPCRFTGRAPPMNLRSLAEYALYTTNRRKNYRRRPRHTYVKLTHQATRLSIEEMKEKVMDHSEWRHVVE